VGRRDERSRFTVDVVLPSPLFTSTFGLVRWGSLLPCQHITDGSIPLDGSPFPVKQCRECRRSRSSPIANTPYCQQHRFSPFSNLRTLTLDPCRRRMPWRTPHFRKRTPKMPLKNSFMTKTPDAARQSHHDDNASTDGPPGLKSVMNRLD
jgi:hypothetical protein